MQLYHGTSYSRGNNIISQNLLDIDAEKVYGEDHGLPTTSGYIYLTDDVFNAIYYGNKTAFFDKEDQFYVFKIEIEDNLLEADMDEFKYTLDPFGVKYELADSNNPTVEESLRYTKSVRIGQNIQFDHFKIQFMKIYSTYYTNVDKNEKNKTRDLLSWVNTDNEYANNRKLEKIAEFEWHSI